LRLRSGNVAAAWEAFESAIRNVTSSADYRNALVSLSEARKCFETGCRWYMQAGNYEAALQLAHLYEKLAQPGAAQELAGQAAEAWGRASLEQAKRALTNEAARQDEEEARKRFRYAGAGFEAAASQTRNPKEQADWLWRSAKD